MKKITLTLLACIQFGFAQINVNPFLVFTAEHQQLPDSNSYTFDFGKNALPQTNQKLSILGIEAGAELQNSALTPYDNYNDGSHFLLSPFLHYHFNTSFSFDVRVNMENIRDKYVYPQRRFWADNFANGRGVFDVAVIRYKSKNFYLRFGRDYFMPGLYFYENLLFSKYQYPYDLAELAFENRYFKLSSYYLSPTTLTVNNTIYQRHINGHRISVRLPWGYMAFNDVMLYGGINKSIDLMAANPLIFLYPYRKNKKHLDGNNLMSLEIYLNYKELYFYSEILLDDWQADHKLPTDLEPTEWGLNMTIGANRLVPGLDWKFNYTRVANRTYNVEINPYEKYLNRNYPIGHWLGNNFWELKSTLTLRSSAKWVTDITLSFLQYGDEAVYGAFNTDYENFTVAHGYSENFPFGAVKTQSGLTLNSYYNLSADFLMQGRFSYWLKNARLAKDINFGLSIAYRLGMSVFPNKN